MDERALKSNVHVVMCTRMDGGSVLGWKREGGREGGREGRGGGACEQPFRGSGGNRMHFGLVNLQCYCSELLKC